MDSCPDYAGSNMADEMVKYDLKIFRGKNRIEIFEIMTYLLKNICMVFKRVMTVNTDQKL